MPTTYSVPFAVAEVDYPEKPAAQRSDADGAPVQTRDLMRSKVKWIERYKPLRQTAAVDTALTNLQTWHNEGTLLERTHPFTGTLYEVKIRIVSGAKARGLNVVFGLAVEFREA